MTLEHELGRILMVISGLGIYMSIMTNISEKIFDH